MKHLLFALILVIISCNNSKSEEKIDSKTDPALSEILDAFFKKYEEETPAAAVDYLFGTNRSFLPQQITELKEKLTDITQKIGAFNGIEQITTKKTSPSLVFFSYLIKHDNQPLRFTFIFYKPKDQWVVYQFKFDDQVDAELEESGRIYFIKQ